MCILSFHAASIDDGWHCDPASEPFLSGCVLLTAKTDSDVRGGENIHKVVFRGRKTL